MSTCSGCGGTGTDATSKACLLCRGSGSRVPYDLSDDPAEAADQLELLAQVMGAGDHSPFEAGLLTDTVRQAARRLRAKR